MRSVPVTQRVLASSCDAVLPHLAPITLSTGYQHGGAMNRERAAFAMNVIFALVTLGLLALDVVQMEAVWTRGEMLPLNVTAAQSLHGADREHQR